MSELINWKSGFIRNVITLVTGTGLAQLINIFSTPILTRLYTPEEYAAFQLFLSAAAIIAVIATARYELAVVVPKTDEEAKDLLAISSIITLCVAVLTLLAVLAFNSYYTLEKKSFNNWFYLLPLYVIFAGIFQAFNYWSMRKGSFKLNLAGRVGSAGVNAGTSIALGYASFGPLGLILGALISQLAGMLILAKEMLFNIKGFFTGSSKASRKEQLIRHKNFPVYNAPHALIDTLQDNGVVFLLNNYFVSAVVSYYAQAFRILKAPIGFIGSAIYQVLYPKFSEKFINGENLQGSVRSIYIRMALFGAPFFLILWLYTVPLFSWFFGAQWAGAGEIAHILIPWLFLNFIVSPVSCIALIAGKQKTAALITIVEVIVRLSAIIYGGIIHDYLFAFSIISIFESALMIFAMCWYYHIAVPPQHAE